MADDSKTAAISGPWIAESRVCEDAEERGLAVIAVVPEVQRNGFDTPTRGIVAWVHSGAGACVTDEQAVATAALIASAPDMRAEIERLHGLLWEIVRDPEAAYSGDWLERVGEALPCQEKAS